MNDIEEKAAGLQKFVKLFETKPEAGLLKPKIKATNKDGVVTLKAGNSSWEEDFPPSLGGRDTTIGPIPHLLGSLAGCAAGLIKNTLAPQTNTSIDSVDADVQCEFDLKGILGMEGAKADIGNVSLTVTVYSNDSQDKIEKLLEEWKKRCPVYLCFTKPIQVSTNLIVKKSESK